MLYISKWTEFMHKFKRKCILRTLLFLSSTSAKNPVKTILLTIALSFFLIIYGVFTNFYVETDESILMNPTGSVDNQNKEWIANESGFPKGSDGIRTIIHSQADDVLDFEGMNRAFEVIDLVRNFDGYEELCPQNSCKISSPTVFLDNHNKTFFKEHIKSVDDLKMALSAFVSPTGELIVRDSIYGDSIPEVSVQDLQVFAMKHLVEENSNSPLSLVASAMLEEAAIAFKLESAKSFHVFFELPFTEESKIFEDAIIKRLHELIYEWEESGDFRIAITCRSCAADAVMQSLIDDAPLLVIAFLTMIIVCIFSLIRCDHTRSRGLLGVGAVFTIALSIMTGYGILFCFGIPLTPLSALFPYIMLGVGLDDTFILTDAFERVEYRKESVRKVEETIETVGVSITLSTCTTVVAYFLGCTSSTAGIRWFCLFAGVTVFVDFIYQITFFIALMVIDDQRMKAKCVYIEAIGSSADLDAPTRENIQFFKKLSNLGKVCIKNLFRPRVKICVLGFFALLFVGGVYIASGIETGFDGLAVYPKDSIVKQYFHSVMTYSTSLTTNVAGIYFRDVDVSDENIQNAMTDYVNRLVEKIPYVTSPPLFFWVRDFRIFVNSDQSLKNDAFNMQLDKFLDTEPYKDLYTNDIVRDENGTVMASRSLLVYDNITMFDIKNEVKAFNLQREVTIETPINGGLLNSHFFTYGKVYSTWELWDLVIKEILMTTGLGILGLFVMCLIFVPHPMAACLMVPTVLAIYIETLAIFRLSGLDINAISAVGLVTCIGLVIDYSNHICMTYFEITDAKSRNERAERVLSTIGLSVLKGGLTTFVGVIPLGFNSTLQFQTMFITFIAITSLGISHGFFFIPVVLSIIGPMEENVIQIVEPVEGYLHQDLELQSTYSCSEVKDEVESIESAPQGEDNGTILQEYLFVKPTYSGREENDEMESTESTQKGEDKGATLLEDLVVDQICSAGEEKDGGDEKNEDKSSQPTDNTMT